MLLQNRAMRIMYFLKPTTHAVPFFICSRLLPIQILFFESLSTFMYEISNNSAPATICGIFVKCNSVHSHNTRATVTSFGAEVWNCFPSQICNFYKPAFKKKIRDALLSILETNDEYVETPALLMKMNVLHQNSNLNCLMPLHSFSWLNDAFLVSLEL